MAQVRLRPLLFGSCLRAGGVRIALVLATLLFQFPGLCALAAPKCKAKSIDCTAVSRRGTRLKTSRAKGNRGLQREAEDNPNSTSLAVPTLPIPSASKDFLGVNARGNAPANRLARWYKNLGNRGVSFQFEGDLLGFANLRGGIDTGTVGNSTVIANMSVDTQKLLGWRGGTFDFQLYDHAGRNPTNVLVGDAQAFSRFAAMPFFEVYSLWYQQNLLDNRLRLIVGKIDANSLFGVVTNGPVFMNSTSQVDPTDFTLPTFPAPMPSVNALYTFKRGFYASFGLYDSNSSVGFLNFYGHAESGQPVSNGLFLIGEAGRTWDSSFKPGYDGDFRAGFWGHTGTFTQFSGRQQHGLQGMYFILDQTLWKPSPSANDARGLRAFLEYGRTDAAVASIDRHYGGGLTWTGPVARRPNDIAGFACHDALFSPQQRLSYGHELNLELFYKAQLTDYFAVQPDLQYIQHPSGTYPSSVVGTLRLEFLF